MSSTASVTADSPAGATAADYRYMARALALAERGRYTTHPNPRVGCVIVAKGQIVGEGWHMRAGEPHAEIYAIRQAAERCRGATAYVTLEPCCHHGRTAPCTNALITAGVTRVVAAMADPNPRVAGQGFAQLRQAGIEICVGVAQTQARALNPGYLSRLERGRPWLRVKLAMSLDGRTALADGSSRWITDVAARRDVQHLRASAAAILTGSGTVLADDPRLDVRLPGHLTGPAGEVVPWPQPVRAILDSQGRCATTARVFAPPGQALLFTQTSTVTDWPASVEVQHLPAAGAHLDLHAILAELTRRELGEVLVESGPVLAGALLSEHLVDELVIYLAPHLLGDGARGLLHLPQITRMEDRIELDIKQIRAVGRDLRITALPRYLDAELSAAS